MSVKMYRDSVTRAERALASLETEMGRAKAALASTGAEASRVAASCRGSLSLATLQSRERQLEQARRKEAEAQRKIGNLQDKIASKREELNRHRANLEVAERRAESERERQERRARADQLRHDKAIADQRRRLTAQTRPVVIKRLVSAPVVTPPLCQWRDKYADLIYLIEIHTPDGNVRSGTAFLYAPRRFATCAHNAEGAVYVRDPLLGQRPAREIRLHPLFEAKGIDVATFTVAGNVTLPAGFVPAATEATRPGDEVAALAYPAVPRRQPTLGFYGGHVEALPSDYSGEVKSIQVSIAIAGGMSGGPVVRQDGRVVGIVSEATFAESNEEGIPCRRFHHAVPIAHLLEMVQLSDTDSEPVEAGMGASMCQREPPATLKRIS